LWKDGGPVIGIQVDNEFGGSPNYLMALKKIAIESGIDVPLYIKTGWPAMRTPVPLGELLPLFGAYPDGFWERAPADGWRSWGNFTFKITRTDTGIGNDTLMATVIPATPPARKNIRTSPAKSAAACRPRITAA
jgi:beta-galactosidase